MRVVIVVAVVVVIVGEVERLAENGNMNIVDTVDMLQLSGLQAMQYG